MACILTPKAFPNLSHGGAIFDNITTVSQSDDMLVVVYGTHHGYCGFVVHPNEKERFLQENKEVAMNLDLLAAEWQEYPQTLRVIFSESKDFLSRPDVETVSFNVTYHRRHDPGSIKGLFISNRDAWEKFVGL